MNNPGKYFSALFIIVSLFCTSALAAGRLKVSEEGTINKDADTVWSVIGDFGGLTKWMGGGNMKLELTGTSTDAGSTRTLTMGNGFSITEALVDYDAENRSYSYIAINGGGSVKNYLSTLHVEPTGKDTCKVIWSATFDPKEGSDDEAAKQRCDRRPLRIRRCRAGQDRTLIGG